MDWVPVKVHYYPTALEAAPDQAVLEDAGIRTVLLDDNITALEWPLHRAVGGTKIAVAAADHARAVALLGGDADAALAEGEAATAPPASWLDDDERAANRLQTIAVVSLIFSPLVIYYWVAEAAFRRSYPDPGPGAARRLRRARFCALVVSGMLLLPFAMIPILAWT